MDKTGIIVVSLCGALLVWWFVEQNKIAQQQAEYLKAHPVAVATNAVATVTTTSASAVTTPATPAVFNPNAPEETLVRATSSRAAAAA